MSVKIVHVPSGEPPVPHAGVVSSKHELKYARALDDLDARKAAGQVSPNEYEVRRAQLMKEASKRRWHWGIQLAVIVGILLAFILVLRIVGGLINAAGV